MPFIVTTKRPVDIFAHGHIVSRLAFATLEEAHIEAMKATIPGTSRDRLHAGTLPESGGTVGPLPDGTTITVEPITWRELAKTAGTRWSAVVPGWDARAIAAFNAKQASGGRIHMGAGTCLSAAPSGEASVCPCVRFVPDLMAALEKSLKDVRDGRAT